VAGGWLLGGRYGGAVSARRAARRRRMQVESSRMRWHLSQNPQGDTDLKEHNPRTCRTAPYLHFGAGLFRWSPNIWGHCKTLIERP